MLTYERISKGSEHGEGTTAEWFYAYEEGVKVGEAYAVTDDEHGDTLVDWVEIYGENKGRGLGTEFLTYLAGEFGSIVLAPNNEDAQRLYERIGEDASEMDYTRWVEQWQYVDQGYGVYRI